MSAAPAEKKFHYLAQCSDFDDSNVAELNAMTAAAVDCTYDTLRRHCVGLTNWALEHSYAERGGRLTLRRDWHVSYHKSRIFGRRCYYLRWSSFEVIWIEGDPKGLMNGRTRVP